MAFRKLPHAGRKAPTQGRFVTIAPGSNQSIYLAMSREAVTALGDPVAVHFEWDSDDYLLRIVASSPDDPAAYPIPKTKRLSVGPMLADLGVRVTERTRIPVASDSRLSVVADLSDLPAASQVTPMRRAS